MVELERTEVLRLAEEGARLLALRQLDEARAALTRAGDPEDGEAVHDVRVALRRLRCSLGAYRPLLDEEAARSALGRAGRLAGQMGGARDQEVWRPWLAPHSANRRGPRREAHHPHALELEARHPHDLTPPRQG
ncbi:MAG: CHAD domain-containing protein, partial [Myxococcota bacterium]